MVLIAFVVIQTKFLIFFLVNIYCSNICVSKRIVHSGV